MLIPENCASNVMYAATKAAAKYGVNGERRALFETLSTVKAKKNEMTSSAAKAMGTPDGPGLVTAKFTLGCVKKGPRMSRDKITPASPPTN